MKDETRGTNWQVHLKDGNLKMWDGGSVAKTVGNLGKKVYSCKGSFSTNPTVTYNYTACICDFGNVCGSTCAASACRACNYPYLTSGTKTEDCSPLGYLSE